MASTRTKTRANTQQQMAGEAPQGNLPAVQLQEKMKNFMQEFKARQRAYEPLLPPHVSFERFEASVRAAIVKNPDILTKCIPATIFRACAEAAELGLSLSPTLREADILIVWNERMNGYEAQFRPRYGGLMKLARQSGEITDISAHEVYEWDEFDYEYGLNEHLEHRPGRKPANYEERPFWGITHAYCVWEIGGRKKFEVMEQADLVRIMNRTSSKDRRTGEIKGPWINDKPEMCRKTVVRRSSKYMPLSAEKMKAFATAVNLDDRREGGEQVTLKDGDIVDITDFGPADEAGEQQQTQQQTQSRKQQMDDIESRMSGAGQGQQAPASHGQQGQASNLGNGEASSASPPPQQQEAPRQGQAQPGATAQKAPAPSTQRQTVEKLEPPIVNGQKDLATWIKLAEAALSQLDPSLREEWRQKHVAILDACEFTMPDHMDGLVKLLP